MIRLTTPISEKDIESLKTGDKIFLSGIIYTARDAAHKRMLTEQNLPFNIDGSVIYYVGPTPKKENMVIGSCGPTSSYRMDNLSSPLMEKGLKMMIGKGDRSEAFRKSMMKYKALYLITTGGTGALLSTKIKSAEIIAYPDLGPEAIHKLYVEDFPCIVAFDIYGNNIYERGKSNE